MTKYRILSIIPARGGSKGLPKKNIYPLNGIPLIAYTIEASIKSGTINKTIVSSDCKEILDISKKYGAEIINRPNELATDLTPSEPVIAYVLSILEKQNETFDILVLLQPTSPLRNSDDIKNAVELFLSSGASSLISVYEPAHTPYKSFKISENGFLKGLIDDKTPFMRRQDLPKTYLPNGAIYITYSETFLETGSLFSNKTIPYVMSIDRSIDIDNLKDIKLCELILKK